MVGWALGELGDMGCSVGGSCLGWLREFGIELGLGWALSEERVLV